MSPRISIRLLGAQSDQRLLALARDGHERAFEALVQRYRRPLLRYGRRMRLSDARAEDVLQQALMQAWIALSRGAVVHDARAWLYRIVHNVAVNAIRRAEEPSAELTPALQDRAALATPSNIERVLAARDALGEVAALPRMQRQAIFLTAVDGQTHSEVADALGVSEGALRGLLYRARATLRTAAAALTPPPLLAWAAGGTGPGAPTVERIAELGAGGGAAAGIAGLVLKGSVVAVTAGALATGASVIAVHERHAGQMHARVAASQQAKQSAVGDSAAPAGAARGISAALLGQAAPLSRSSVERAARHRHGGRSDQAAGRGARRGRDGPRVAHELTAVVLPPQAESERGAAHRSEGSGSPRGREGHDRHEGFDAGRVPGAPDHDAREAESHPRGSRDAGRRPEASTQSPSAHRGDSGSEDAAARSEATQSARLESRDSHGEAERTETNSATTQPAPPKPDEKSGSGDGRSGGSGGSTGGSS